MEASSADKVAEQTVASGAAAAPTASPIQARLEELRGLADSLPVRAQQDTWAWFEELGKKTDKDRQAGAAELNELFRLGTPPRDLSGETEGILVAATLPPGVDQLVGVLTARWMPWQGKRFQVSRDKGDNLLTGSARFPAKLIWPLYGTKAHDRGRSAFEFDMRIEAGKADPDREVLVIDYSSVPSNPDTIIRQIRDELVEIVPSTYLGKILWAGGIPLANQLPIVGNLADSVGKGWPCIGYFALKQPL
jgi:hypothetical protein